MAKADFCFTYYDGDAARDMAHMNRLERGAYTDIIISQRKFGRLTLEQIQKILGRDFAECWPAIELIMSRAEGKFYVGWLEASVLKSQKHSKKQSENAANRYQTDAKQMPNSAKRMPLEDGYGDGNGSIVDRKGVQGETIDSRLDAAFVDLYLEPLLMNGRNLYPGIDIPLELERFRQKVRGSPSVFASHDTGGLRMAFEYQLRNARPQTPHKHESSKRTAANAITEPSPAGFGKL
jgi:hypothetical protein